MQNSNFRTVSPNVTDGGPQGKKENQEKVTSPTMGSPNSEKNLTEAEIQVIHYKKYFEITPNTLLANNTNTKCLKISQKVPFYKGASFGRSQLLNWANFGKSKQRRNGAKFQNNFFILA